MDYDLYKPRLSQDTKLLLQTTYRGALEMRQRLDPTYKDIAMQFNPTLQEWDMDPNNVKAIDLKYLYDSTGWKASARLADAWQSYSCGRHVPWFRLGTEDPDRDSRDEEASYLQLIERDMYSVFARSNFYDENRLGVRACADLATAIMYRDVNDERGVPSYKNLKLARCSILDNDYGEADTLFHECWYRAPDAVKKFGKDALPAVITDAYAKGSTKLFPFVMAIFPYGKWDLDMDQKGGKSWTSLWFCMSGDKTWEPIRHWGFDSQPMWFWRWSRNPDGSPLGADSPGFMQVSDSKQLQGMRKEYHRTAQLIGRPPIKATESLQGRIELSPNGITLMRPGEDYAMNRITGDPQFLLEDSRSIQGDIKSAYYNDLFLVLTQNLEGARRTATEVESIRAEQSAMLPGISGRQTTEWLEVAVADLYEYRKARMIYPPPPRSMAGKRLVVHMVSPLAILQRKYLQVDTTKQAIREVLAYAQIDPTILDHYDLGEYGRMVGEVYNIDRRVLRSLIDVERIRKGRAQLQKQERDAELQSKTATAKSKLMGAMSRAPEEGSPMAEAMPA